MGKQDRECALCGKIIVDLQESCILKEAIGRYLHTVQSVSIASSNDAFESSLNCLTPYTSSMIGSAKYPKVDIIYNCDG